VRETLVQSMIVRVVVAVVVVAMRQQMIGIAVG
jgi:hypothetical protein